MLYGSAKIWLNDLSADEKRRLWHLLKMCTELYNLSMRTIAEYYEQTNKILDFQQLKAKTKDSEEYRILTGWYYGIILAAIADFKKYVNANSYALKKSTKILELKNLTDFRSPKPKEKYHIIVSNCKVESGYVFLPKTRRTSEMKIKLPENYYGKQIKKLVVRQVFKDWQLIIEYETKCVAHARLDKSKAIGLDLGITNFVTAATTEGDSYIIDGKYLKSILQGYCKFRAKLLSASGGVHNTKRLTSLHRKTHNKVEDYTRKSVAYIIDYCIENNIGTVFLGWGLHFQNFNIGQSNQLYSLFPFAKFKDLLSFKCKQNGINFKVVDESFTSQASFLDGDHIPDHVTRAPQSFSGKRRYRGLYISKDGIKINADVNGALNILRKGNVNFFFREENSRGFASPKRINPLKFGTASHASNA